MRAANQLVVTVLVFLAVSACPPPPARAADWWESTIVDTGEYMGLYNSLAILPSGQPAISYGGAHELKYAWFDGTSWHTTTVDGAAGEPSSTSLAILSSGQPAISYSARELKYAWFDGTTWRTTIVDPAFHQSRCASLAILPSGQPAISYVSFKARGLKYAWFDGQMWQTTVVDTWPGGTGFFGGTSLVVLPTGRPAFSYLYGSGDPLWGCLKYASFDGSTWHNSIVDDPGPGAWSGASSSMALLPSGQPAISHGHRSALTREELRYSWFDGSEWHTETVDSARKPGWITSLGILPSGQPAIAYCDGDPAVQGTFKLKYAWFDGSNWHTTTIDDSPGDAGCWGASLAILPLGQPAVSYDYWDGTDRQMDLKYAFRRAVSGDVNCDGQVNFDDIDPFVLALTGAAAYQAVYPNCHWLLADANNDGTVDFADIDPFAALLGGG